MTAALVGGLIASCTAAGVFFGLWRGEQARRLDAQRVAARMPLVAREPALVDGRAGRETYRVPEIEEHVVDPERPMFDAATRDSMVTGFMAEFGVDQETAEKAAEETMAAILGQAGLS